MGLTFLVIPVMRRRKSGNPGLRSDLATVHREYLRVNPGLAMVPDFTPELMHGAVGSVLLDDGSAGCSIWSNENLMAEEVVRLPPALRMARRLLAPLVRVNVVPAIPRSGEVLKSWFLFDLFARGPADLRALLRTVNAQAIENGRTVFYVLVQDGDPIRHRIRSAGFFFMTVPYVCLAKGDKTPAEGERLYLDIRDI